MIELDTRATKVVEGFLQVHHVGHLKEALDNHVVYVGFNVSANL